MPTFHVTEQEARVVERTYAIEAVDAEEAQYAFEAMFAEEKREFFAHEETVNSNCEIVKVEDVTP